jgi:hypothetical protein
VTLRTAFFSVLFAIVAVSIAAPAAASDDDHEPFMSALAYGGWTHAARGASVPIGYTIGVSFGKEQHFYTGMVFGASLGPDENIGIDSQGNPSTALDAGILVGGELGYEQTIGDSALVRGTLGLGGYFWSRQAKPDDVEDRIHANGFVVVPSMLIGGLAGPVVIGLETRGILGTVPTELWSYGALLVVGGRFELK